MEAAKVIIEIVVGLIPNEPIKELTKVIIITSKEWESAKGEDILKAYGFAQEYMRTLWDPRKFNWVQCNWIYL